MSAPNARVHETSDQAALDRTTIAALPADNPFAAPSDLPYGLPRFADIREEHFRPAFEAGMAQHLAEVEAIASDPAPATFENTIEALERAGQLLHRVSTVFFERSSTDSNDFTDELEAEMSPRLTAHYDAITLDGRLFARIDAVAASLAERADLSDEARYLVERTRTDAILAGAALDEAGKTRLRELNTRLSELQTAFQRNLLADTTELALVVDDAAELEGLSEGEIAAAAADAAAQGLEGRYRIPLTLFTGHPKLASLANRETRRRLLEASLARGSRDNANDNRPVVLEMARLRAERAELLGFPNHSALIAADSTAGSPEAIAARLAELSAPAARNARAEAARLQALIDEQAAEHGEEPFPLEAWDWHFYTEQIRSRDYDLDTARLRPYFEAERVLRDGVFAAATGLYGIRFEERPDLVGHSDGTRVFEVLDEAGEPVGLYCLDLYARDSKRGGAWMMSFQQQNELLGEETVVINVLNVPRPAEGEPTLLTLDEVETLFHEFGHALHGLFAHVTYPSLAGTNVFRDFVEFPSQVNEMWMLHPDVLPGYARHHETGEALDPAVIDRLQSSAAFNEGFSTAEYLAASVLDQAWHTLSAEEARAVTDVAAFEAKALADAGLDLPAVPTRYSTTYFQHVFAGGYSAGYYGYIWSEVLDADTVEWFREHGGLRRENGQRFRERLLGVGGSKDPLEAYRDFRGRDAEIGPLLERRGLTA